MILVYEKDKEIGRIEGEEIYTSNTQLDSLFYQLVDEGVPVTISPGTVSYEDMDEENIQEALEDFGYEIRLSKETQDGRSVIERQFQGFNIVIENDTGTVRSGTNPDGNWYVTMTYPYGYIENSEGVDGDHVDCFIGPNEQAKEVYVVHVLHAQTGEYDEDKLMLGFDDAESAKKAFLENYSDPKFFGSLEIVPVSQLQTKLDSHHGKKIGALDVYVRA